MNFIVKMARLVLSLTAPSLGMSTDNFTALTAPPLSGAMEVRSGGSMVRGTVKTVLLFSTLTAVATGISMAVCTVLMGQP
ncbi:hypothetical protein CXP34_00780 [Ralstonia mannitolilytica]|nr:hypothetical protein CXP34_00780 [Ralstonia mannitolilytica]